MMDVVPTGVDGLDEMLGGGIPRGHVVALLGSFGTGKTTFALQFIMQGLINGEKGIFITLEEDVESILRTAQCYGWDLRSHVDEKSAALIKLEPADAKATATRVRSELPAFIKGFGAARIGPTDFSMRHVAAGSSASTCSSAHDVILGIASSTLRVTSVLRITSS